MSFTHLQAPAGGPEVAGLNEWLNPSFRFPAQGFSLEEAISRLIQQALAQTGNNVSAAARMLGVSRDYLRYRLPGGKSDDSLQGEPGQ